MKNSLISQNETLGVIKCKFEIFPLKKIELKA